MSSKITIDTEQARRLLNRGESYSSVARQLGTSARTLKRRLGEDAQQNPAVKVKTLESELCQTREEIWQSWREWSADELENLDISADAYASVRWHGLNLRQRFFEDLDISPELSEAFDDWEQLILRVAEVSVRLARDAKPIRDADRDGVQLIRAGVEDYLDAEARRVFGTLRRSLDYEERTIGDALAERIRASYAEFQNDDQFRLWRYMFDQTVRSPGDMNSMLGTTPNYGSYPEIATIYLHEAVGSDSTAIAEALRDRQGAVIGSFRAVVEDFEDQFDRWWAVNDCRAAVDELGGYDSFFRPLRLNQFAERRGGELSAVRA